MIFDFVNCLDLSTLHQRNNIFTLLSLNISAYALTLCCNLIQFHDFNCEVFSRIKVDAILQL